MTDSDADLHLTARRTEPSEAMRSSVPILRNRSSYYSILGSGTLFKVADSHFVVTARHVVEDAQIDGDSIAIGTASGVTMDVGGEWRSSVKDSAEDIAVYRLSAAQVGRLAENEFVLAGRYRLNSKSDAGFYVIFGFPQIASQGAQAEHARAMLTHLRLRTAAYAGSHIGLNGYDANLHVLLDADETGLKDDEHSETSMRTLNGVRVPLVEGLRGISGGGVWRLGERGLPVAAWTADHARIVGVETAVYQNSRAIRVTRWACVMERIASAFPDLRSAMRLHGH
jgi:hypothetical protein